MKLLCFSDTHITPKGEFSSPNERGLTDYLERVIRSWGWMISQVEEHEPEYVFFLGDLFETTGFVDTASLTVATELLQDLLRSFRYPEDMYFIVGNHDFLSTRHDLHNLHLLRGSGINVVSDPDIVTLNGCNIGMIPWAKDPCDHLRTVIDCDVVMSHIDIRGSMFNSKKRSDHGADPDNLKQLVLNGHYHSPHRVRENIYNIGALLSRNFHDADSAPRGIVIVDYHDGIFKVDRINNPHDVGFLNIDLTDDAQRAAWSCRLDEGDIPQAYAKLRFKSKDKALANQIGSLLQDFKSIEVPEIIYEVKENRVSEDFSPEENFKRYVDETLIFDKEGDRAQILERGLTYLSSIKVDRAPTLPITFEKLEVNNYQSIGSVTIDLSTPGLTYVEGRNEDEPAESNGAGKSTIHEAIFWCLTGRSLRGFTGDDVIHWDRSYCNVKLWLTIGDRKYFIFRSRQDPDDGTTVQLWLRGESGMTDVSCRRKTDTDANIASILGRSRDVLQHSIFLTADLQTKFTSLSYPDRIRLIEQVTDSQIYEDARKHVDKDYCQAERSVFRSRTEVSSIKSRISHCKGRLAELTGELTEAQRERDSNVASIKRELAFSIRIRDELDEQITHLSDDISDKRSQIEKLSDNLITVQDLQSKRRAELAVIEAKSSSIQLSVKETEAGIVDGTCSFCGSKIDTDSQLANKVRFWKQDLESLRLEKQSLERQMTIPDDEISRIRSIKSDLNNSLDSLENSMRIALLKKDEVTRAIENLKRSLDKERSSLNVLKARKEEVKVSLDEAQESLDSAEQEVLSFEHEMYVLAWLQDAFSTKGIRARMLSSVTLPFLNSYLQTFSELLGMPCLLVSERELKSGEVLDQIDVLLPGKRTYKACSRGERRKVDLAIQCSLNELAIATSGSHVNLLICDEVVDPLDNLGVSNFVDVLKQKSSNMSVFLMAHRPFLDTLLPNKLTLVKRNGVTSVLE